MQRAQIIDQPPDGGTTSQLGITINSPTDGATISGRSPAVPITVSGTVSTSGGATAEAVSVQLGENAPWQAAIGTSEWSFSGSVDSPGALTISARVDGHMPWPEPEPISDSASIAVTVTMADVTPPELTITAPPNGATVYGDGRVSRVTVGIDALDRLSGLKTIQWLVDDVVQATEVFPVPAPSWSGTKEVSIPASPVSNHTIKVRCADASQAVSPGGNVIERAVTVVTPDTTGPFYEILEPREGAKIPGGNAGTRVTVRGRASDLQSGVESVYCSLVGGPTSVRASSTDGFATWEAPVDIPTYGFHAIAVRFRDRAGNESASVINLEVARPYRPRDANDLLSAREYLRHLLWFGGNHVRTPSAPLTEQLLAQVFHQPFATLSDPQDPLAQLGDQQVNQVRVCIEVLRRYLETAWVDDALPTGAVGRGEGGDTWNWVTSNPTPFHGTRAHQSSFVSTMHQHLFTGATRTLPVGAGEWLFAYIYLDPASPPTEVMLQWYDGSWEHRAFWGADQIPWGVAGTASRRSMGPLPPVGRWVRLEVPASQVGLEGRTLSGMAFTLYGGRATWDRAGKARGSRTDLLSTAESRYRQAAYTALLNRIGTSYEEIRLIRGANADVRKALAARLGIDLDPLRPDQLDKLLLPEPIAEPKLEELFGLLDTTLDPWRLASVPQFLTWQLACLRTVWKQQDYVDQPGAEPRPPAIDPDLTGDQDLSNAVPGNAAFDLWRARASWTEDRLRDLRARRRAEQTALAGFNRIVAETLGPVGHWKFDEGSGGTASDASGNNNPGTLQGAAWSAGKIGTGALAFDGVDDYVQVGPAARLALTEAGSIAAWIHPRGPGTAGTGGVIVNKESEYEVARFPDGTIQWAFANAAPGWTWINTGFVAPADQWTHLAVVYDQGRVDTYANGQLVHTYSGAGSIGDANTTLNDLRIGGRQGVAQHFHGLIDDVRIYNRALGAPEVAALATFPGLDLVTLAEEHRRGRDIGPALRALQLTPAAFWHLVRMRSLAEAGTVADAEWEDVYAILVQVKKAQAYPAWRGLERQRQIALTPDHFKISASPRQLPAWRATQRARREWQDTLQARIDQEQSVRQALQAAVHAVEEATLPALRDALVAETGAAAEVSAAADRLTDQLLIDARGGGSRQTTRVLQAIETLQSVLFSLRTGRFEPSHPAKPWVLTYTQAGSGETETQFDDEWRWMSSSATWRAAMLVFFYPENILLPSLREAGERTEEFDTLVTEVRRARLTADEARTQANSYLQALRTRLGASLPAELRDPAFGLTEQLTDAQLDQRRELAMRLLDPYVDRAQTPPRLRPTTPGYLKEVFYFVPLQLALQLQKSGEYIAALDWFQTVYAYNLPVERRKIYYGLALEQNLPPNLSQTQHWLREWLSPHTLAANRPNPYTRYTLMSLARCFLEFADAEFTRDTGESVANARSLYLTARSLLSLPELRPPPAAGPNDTVLPNPVLNALGLRAETQLAKLRQGRNIAGMKRQLELPTPSQTVSGLPTLGSGGRLVVPELAAPRPTPYRYSVLIERSKQLVGLAQQMEAAYLAALEKRDVENYNLRKAGYDLELAQAGVSLQDLRVTEARGGERLAELQQQRADVQKERFGEWISGGLNWYENALLQNYTELNRRRNWMAAVDAALTTSQAVFSAVDTGRAIAAGVVVGALAGTRAWLTTQTNNIEHRIQAYSLLASHERRVAEWELQQSLAAKDWEIAGQQRQLAGDHVAVALQEQAIARTQSTQASAMANFLAHKFTNAELYEWMSGVLAGVYSYFLQQATATARLAQHQLAFERQEAPPSFIQADYWQPPSEPSAAGASDGRTPDRRGLTGSARLLEDIFRLDQHAFDTDKRKLNLSQTFSLAQLAPFEFQQFRESGVLPFTTPLRLFDQGFPGHYLRLIKRVRTSVVALIPPSQGIRATLTASGLSRVVVGGNVFQEVVIRRDPELVALTWPTNATGVFELDAQSEMLNPFEAMGVDTAWELQLPRAANPFDYRTIADVLLTIEYTALHSFDYRRQVVKTLDQKISAERAFSLRGQFPDQWYALHNPAQPGQPLTVRFETLREDFPPNVEALKIEQVLLHFARVEGESFELDITNLRFRPVDGPAVGGGARSIDGVVSTRRGNGSAWISMRNATPAGEWELTLPAGAQSLFREEKIEDILLVITYAGRTPEWPA